MSPSRAGALGNSAVIFAYCGAQDQDASVEINPCNCCAELWSRACRYTSCRDTEGCVLTRRGPTVPVPHGSNVPLNSADGGGGYHAAAAGCGASTVVATIAR